MSLPELMTRELSDDDVSCVVRGCECDGSLVESCGCDHATGEPCARHAAALDWWRDTIGALTRLADARRHCAHNAIDLGPQQGRGHTQ